MKFSILALVTVSLISTASFASRSDVQVISLSNSNIESTVSLSAELYRTEYLQEWQNDTCYRDVCSGSTEVCDWEPGTETCTNDRDCEIVDGVRSCTVTPVCSSSGGGYSCHSEQSCSTESYDCSGYVSIPYEVFDHTTKAQVRVVLKDIATGLNVNEKLSVKLSGDSITVSSDSKTSNALLIGALTKTENLAGGLKTIEAVVTIKAIPVTDAIAPLSAIKISEVKDGLVTLTSKDTKSPELFKVELKVTKPKFLAHDPEMANGSVSLLDAKVLGAGQWQIDLSQIGLDWSKLPADKYKMAVKLMSAIDYDKIINRGVLPSKLSVEDSVKFKKK